MRQLKGYTQTVKNIKSLHLNVNWDSLWQAELFLHLPKMKDENLYFTNYSMMTLLPCSQLFLVIILDMERKDS